jgi:hypothetical protein
LIRRKGVVLRSSGGGGGAIVQLLQGTGLTAGQTVWQYRDRRTGDVVLTTRAPAGVGEGASGKA